MMNDAVIITTAVIYLFAGLTLVHAVRRQQSRWWGISCLIAVVGVLSNALVLYQAFHLTTKLLSASGLFVLGMWVEVILALLINIRYRVAPLLLLSYLVIIIALFAFLFAKPATVTAINASFIWHVVLGVITFSVVVLVAFQTLLTNMQAYLLHEKNAQQFRCQWVQQLAPLQTMEMLLFKLLWLSFLLLTSIGLTSLWLLYEQHNQLELPWHKLIAVFVSWAVIGIVLLGHYIWRWHGRKARYASFVAVFLIIVVYFSSSI